MGFFHPPSSLVVGVLREEEEVGYGGWVGGLGGGEGGGSNALL